MVSIVFPLISPLLLGSADILVGESTTGWPDLLASRVSNRLKCLGRRDACPTEEIKISQTQCVLTLPGGLSSLLDRFILFLPFSLPHCNHFKGSCLFRFDHTSKWKFDPAPLSPISPIGCPGFVTSPSETKIRLRRA